MRHIESPVCGPGLLCLHHLLLVTFLICVSTCLSPGAAAALVVHRAVAKRIDSIPARIESPSARKKRYGTELCALVTARGIDLWLDYRKAHGMSYAIHRQGRSTIGLQALRNRRALLPMLVLDTQSVK